MNNIIPLKQTESTGEGKTASEKATSYSASYLASYPHARAREESEEAPPISAEARALKDCATHYCDALGRQHCCTTVLREIAQWIQQGMAAECVRYALDAAADAPRPSWAYARAVLRHLQAEGIRDQTGIEQRNTKRQDSREQRRQNPALNYPQRSYDEEFFERFYAKLNED